MQIRTKQIADLLTTCVPIIGSTLDVDLNGKILSNLLTPLLIGGTAVGSTLTYKTTTGIGTTDAHIFQVGNNGATEAMRITNTGNLGILNSVPLAPLDIGGTFFYENSASVMPVDKDAYVGILRTTNGGAAPFNQSGSMILRPRVSATAGRGSILFYSGSPTAERMRISENGNIGIGILTPTAVLHLKGGSASSSSSPLKFTSGALNITPEVGAIEFLTDAYYATITTGAARKTFAFLESNAVNNKGINVTFDGQGIIIPLNTNSIIAAAATNGTITAWFIEGDVSGSIVIDILKNGVSMSGAGNKPTLASALTANAAVSGWTSLSFATNDKLEIKVTTASTTLTKCYLTIKYNIS